MDEKGLLMRLIAYFPILEDPTSTIDLKIFNNEKEMIDLLRLRDKVFYFILRNLKKILQDWDVIKNIRSEDEKAIHVEVYLNAINHYAQKYINQFTRNVATKAKNMSITFESQYYKIGTLFKPKQVNNNDCITLQNKKETHLSTPELDKPSISLK